MALILSREIEGTDIYCEYWNIKKISFNHKEKQCEVILNGYKNKAARLANKTPLTDTMSIRVAFSFEGDNYNYLLSDNMTQKSYLNIKTIWASAQDDL